jgi:hypothetical protein
VHPLAFNYVFDISVQRRVLFPLLPIMRCHSSWGRRWSWSWNWKERVFLAWEDREDAEEICCFPECM